GQEEPPRSPVLVDCALDRVEQVWRALHLVEGQTMGAPHQLVGRIPRLGQDVVVVQRQVDSVIGGEELTHERALPRLARAVDDDHRAYVERGSEWPGDGAGRDSCGRGIVNFIHGMNDIYSRGG